MVRKQRLSVDFFDRIFRPNSLDLLPDPLAVFVRHDQVAPLPGGVVLLGVGMAPRVASVDRHNHHLEPVGLVVHDVGLVVEVVIEDLPPPSFGDLLINPHVAPSVRAVASRHVIVAQPPVIHHDVVWSSRLQGKEGDALPLLELLVLLASKLSAQLPSLDGGISDLLREVAPLDRRLRPNLGVGVGQSLSCDGSVNAADQRNDGHEVTAAGLHPSYSMASTSPSIEGPSLR
jgi:hypothetical protein